MTEDRGQKSEVRWLKSEIGVGTLHAILINLLAVALGELRLKISKCDYPSLRYHF